MSREGILNKIGKILDKENHGQNNLETRQKSLLAYQKLKRQTLDITPIRNAKDHLLEHFRAKAEAVSATSEVLKSPAEIPTAVADYINRQGLEKTIRMTPNDFYKDLQLNWLNFPEIILNEGYPSPFDRIALTFAMAGLSETGSLVVSSGKNLPILDHFYPETEIIILFQDKLFVSMEDFWQEHILSLEEKGAKMARAISLITGPSRTGDIAQKIELGAHGPLRLHILIISNRYENEC